MSAIIVSKDGQLSNVNIRSKTLDEAFGEYDEYFPDARDVEMNDIYVRRGDVVGTREGVSVFYDSAGVFQGKNKYFEGKTRPVFGGVLAVWTRIAAENSKKCDDVLLDRPLTENEFMNYVTSFEDDLAKFVRRVSHPQLRVRYELFPTINKAWAANGTTWYTLNDVDLRNGNKGSHHSSAGRHDVDLLTHRFKWRTYCCSLAFPKSSVYVKALTEEYRYEFCVSCSKAVTAKCSKCGGYYSCGGAECQEEARALHRPNCVST